MTLNGVRPTLFGPVVGDVAEPRIERAKNRFANAKGADLGMFNYDWFHGPAYEQQRDEAMTRCAGMRFPNLEPFEREEDNDFQQFRSELLVRTLIYLRDGFSYEIRQLAEVGSKSHLVFECEPVDEQYKVGAFVVTVPFEEIVRVEVFAVHPSEKPEELPQITGFRNSPEGPDGRHPEKPVKSGRGER